MIVINTKDGEVFFISENSNIRINRRKSICFSGLNFDVLLSNIKSIDSISEEDFIGNLKFLCNLTPDAPKGI